jgi:hypothetical protein
MPAEVELGDVVPNEEWRPPSVTACEKEIYF